VNCQGVEQSASIKNMKIQEKPMKKLKNQILIDEETLVSKIFVIRSKKIMLDRDLANLYGVETRTLNQSVKRNIERFPEDFMFQLTKPEFENWKSQIVISKKERMGLRKIPLAFTEQGVSMLSSVLNSKKAIQVNIQIMRVFTRFRQMLTVHSDLKRKIDSMEKKYDGQFKIVFSAIKKLLEEPKKTKRKEMGFHVIKSKT